MKTTLEMRGERKTLAEQANAILTKARDENREMTAEEEQKFDAIHADIDKLRVQIEREERQERVNVSLSESQGRRTDPAPPGREPLGVSQTSVLSAPLNFLEGVRAWLLAGSDIERTAEMRESAARFQINLDQRQLHIKLPRVPLGGVQIGNRHEVRAEDYREWETRNQVHGEQRAQGVGTGAAGGFTVQDETMRALETAMLQFGGMRQVATILRTETGAALPFPTVNDTTQTGVLLGENTVVAQQDVSFAQLVLDAFKYSSKMILVSVELLQDSTIGVSQFLGEALGTRIGRISNTHFTTGTGSGQPNGLVTASTVGKTGATGQTTTIVYDDFVDLEHSVDPAYRNGARWMFHDGTLAKIKKIKIPQFTGDVAGQPLWQPGLAVGSPDTILGYPYTINQDVAQMAANAKSVLFGALSKYLIREVRDIVILRLDERFADFHQVAFLAFARMDGDLLNAGTNPVKHYANSAT